MSAGITTSSRSSIRTPLSHVVPWQANTTVLVTDSVETDGRFVLHTLVASKIDEDVLWMCCSSMTDRLTLAALKKIGYHKSSVESAHLPAHHCENGLEVPSLQQTNTPRLTIHSIPTMIDAALSSNTKESALDTDSVVKTIYKTIKSWIARVEDQDASVCVQSSSWVIIDDVSSLATLIGERMAYDLILAVLSLKSRNTSRHFGLALRCSNINDINSIAMKTSNWDDEAEGRNDAKCDAIRWEHALVELADVIADVVPLESGYTRDTHGRLIFTGRSIEISLAYNYSLTENQVLVLQLN